jgi:hypothetical protein
VQRFVLTRRGSLAWTVRGDLDVQTATDRPGSPTGYEEWIKVGKSDGPSRRAVEMLDESQIAGPGAAAPEERIKPASLRLTRDRRAAMWRHGGQVRMARLR